MAQRKQDAPFGYDVVGEDGRRIVRNLTEQEAQQEAHRISSQTGEDLDVVPSEARSAAVPGPAPDANFPPIAETLSAPEDA